MRKDQMNVHFCTFNCDFFSTQLDKGFGFIGFIFISQFMEANSIFECSQSFSSRKVSRSLLRIVMSHKVLRQLTKYWREPSAIK